MALHDDLSIEVINRAEEGLYVDKYAVTHMVSLEPRLRTYHGHTQCRRLK